MGEFLGKMKAKFLRPMSWIQSNKFRLAACVGVVGLIGALSYAGHEYVKANTKSVVKVYIGHVEAGIVADQEKIEQYIEDKYSQVLDQNPDVHMEMDAIHVRYETDHAFRPEFEEREVLAAVDESLHFRAYGVQLIVDGQVVGIVKDKDTAHAILDSVRDKFSKTDAAAQAVRALSASAEATSSKARIESVGFKQRVDLKTVEIKPDELVEPDVLIERLLTGDVKDTTYTVQKGDCIICIARKLDISTQVIYDNNPWIVDDAIFIGDVLDVTVLDPTLSVVTTELVDESQPIQFPTVYEQDDTLKKGTTKVVQQGVNGRKIVTFRLTKINGRLSHEQLVHEQIVESAVPAIIKRGTKVIPGEGTGTFAWPVNRARVSSGYGKRWGALHKGIDLISSDRNIKAADHGTVVFAGTKNGYGNTIMIDHNNGYTTLYGHLKSISVKKGTNVEKGENIAVMGNTGESTGVHLHFEIHKNGSVQNPISYLNQ